MISIPMQRGRIEIEVTGKRDDGQASLRAEAYNDEGLAGLPFRCFSGTAKGLENWIMHLTKGISHAQYLKNLSL
jgi:hypothetical protein